MVAFAVVFFLASASDVMVNGHVMGGMSDSLIVILFAGMSGAYVRHRVRRLRHELDLWRDSKVRTP